MKGRVSTRKSSLEAASLAPYVTWGTNPAQVTRIDGTVPDPSSFANAHDREAAARALEYMGLAGGTSIHDIAVDTVFIGSCTNGRIEDLRAAAGVLRRAEGASRAPGPGGPRLPPGQGPGGVGGAGRPVHRGRFRLAGARMLDVPGHEPGQAGPGERAASTSNRNFEGRQGRGGRTHLVSPAVAAATAVAGHFATPEDLI